MVFAQGVKLKSEIPARSGYAASNDDFMPNLDPGSRYVRSGFRAGRYGDNKRNCAGSVRRGGSQCEGSGPKSVGAESKRVN